MSPNNTIERYRSVCCGVAYAGAIEPLTEPVARSTVRANRVGQENGGELQIMVFNLTASQHRER